VEPPASKEGFKMQEQMKSLGAKACVPMFLLVAVTATDGSIRKEYFSTPADVAVHTDTYFPLLKSSASIRNYCCL